MATKAAKSITINATKYELANSLDYQNGKVQLKAKDVVLDEVEVGGSDDFVITLDANQHLSTTGMKTCTPFNGVALANAVKAGKTIKIVGTGLLNEDDNPRDSICLVCSATDADQGAQVFLTGVDGLDVLTFVMANYTDVSSINLINIFALIQA